MPRGPRLDAPGITHHVMIRGVGGCEIFRDDDDREDLATRLDIWVPASRSACLASVFMTNHVHVVLESGVGGLSQLMARVLTGYALRFNRRHGRAGHLFQNRFRSKLIADDAYRTAAIAYVFRNLIELGFTLEQVIANRWCSLGATLGVRPARAFESVSRTLAVFGDDPRALLAAIERAEPGCDPWQWREFEPKPEPKPPPPAPEVATLGALIERVCAANRVPHASLLGGARTPAVVAARRALVTTAVLELGMRPSEIARRLALSRQTVSQIVSTAVGGRSVKNVRKVS